MTWKLKLVGGHDGSSEHQYGFAIFSVESSASGATGDLDRFSLFHDIDQKPRDFETAAHSAVHFQGRDSNRISDYWLRSLAQDPV